MVRFTGAHPLLERRLDSEETPGENTISSIEAPMDDHYDKTDEDEARSSNR
jgi:hypothetical protein